MNMIVGAIEGGARGDVQPGSAVAAPRAGGASPPTAMVGRNPRILVVDDNVSIHEDFRKILGTGGPSQKTLEAAAAELFGLASPAQEAAGVAPTFDVHTASQGEEGLARVAAAKAAGQPYALAFVDVRMPPGWDGVETVEKMWEVQPDLQVVLCTAYSDYSWNDLVAKLGSSDRMLILKKPFNTIEVQQLATALTEKWRLTQQAQLKIDELEARVRARTAEVEATLEQLAQARKMEAVGQLAGGVAHDYNNILTATLMQLGMLANNPEATPSVKLAVDELEKMARRAAGLTRQLLTFSRRQVAQVKAIDLNEVIENLLKMLQRLLTENIELNYRRSPKPACIEGDVGMIEQVVTNLCVNARDAMMPRGGRLTITADHVTLAEAAVAENPEARSGTFVRLTVEDTGCGMDATTLQHIFEPFFTTKEIGQGTGLGLATVYGIVKQHSGWIEVRSGVDNGTAFRILLPASNRATTPAAAGGAASPSVRHECILVVEDESTVRSMVARTLTRGGYRVLEAADGEDAIRVWAEHAQEIDLLFSDMVMPSGITGLDLAKRFHATRPELKVIVTSGYSLDLSRAGLPGGTAVAYLAKPYEVSGLNALIRKSLGERAG